MKQEIYDEVRKHYPNSFSICRYDNPKLYKIVPERGSEEIVGLGETEDLAWLDAATKIREVDTSMPIIDWKSITKNFPDQLSPEITELKFDMVNHPPHYTASGIECIEAIEAALTPEEFRGFCKGNALKYSWHEKHKGGNEDLKKAQWYLKRITQ